MEVEAVARFKGMDERTRFLTAPEDTGRTASVGKSQEGPQETSPTNPFCRHTHMDHFKAFEGTASFSSSVPAETVP